jgi:structural maintenance of chromosome 2
LLAAKKEQVDAVTAEYIAVKEKHTATQTSLSTAKDLLQTPLAGLAGSSAQSSGGGGYMGQIVDARARLAQAAAEEEQVRVVQRDAGMSEAPTGGSCHACSPQLKSESKYTVTLDGYGKI